MPELNASGESISMFMRGLHDLFDSLGKLAVADMPLRNRFRVVNLFALKLEVVLQSTFVERSIFQRGLDAAAGFGFMRAVGKFALAHKGFNVVKHAQHAAFGVGDGEFAHAGRVEQQSAAFDEMQ